MVRDQRRAKEAAYFGTRSQINHTVMLIMTSVQAGMIRVEAIGAPPLPYRRERGRSLSHRRLGQSRSR